MLTRLMNNRNHPLVLGGLCALITLLAVLRYGMSTPAELPLVLAIWLLCNGMISALLFFYGRLQRSLIVPA
ncbi:MAG: hypothetical protein KF832_17265 [Caldilineaceae bacterium]|nr:hypothetical protein [Caldilineaceae bacterium]